MAFLAAGGMAVIQSPAMAAPGHKVASTHEARADEVFASILQSSAFAKTPSLRQLLTFLWTHRNDAITEYALATEALGRPPGFDPRVDATVRVVVARLRQRLKEFYDGEGVDCPLRLCIPLGAHQLSVQFPEGAAPLPEEMIRAPRRPFPWVALAFGLTAVAAGMVIGLLIPRRVQAHPPLPPFWAAFLDGGRPTALYMPTPNAGGGPRNGTAGPETIASVKLAQFLAARGVHVQVAGPDAWTAGPPDRNLLLPGMAWSSPAVQALSDGANFQLAPEGAEIVRNRAPRTGEPAEYRGRAAAGDRFVHYGVIVQRTTAAGARQLALAGVHTASLVSFLTVAESLDELERAWRKAGRPPDFEALVEAETQGDTAVRARLAAFRALPARQAAGPH